MDTTTPDLRAELADMWRTRPVRAPRDGVFGGVCVAIGRRYQIDPMLIRVAFVVATTLGGGGIIAYIAGLITFPRGTAPAQPPPVAWQGRSRFRDALTHPPTIIALVIALIVIGDIGPGPIGAGFPVGAAALALLWYVLYRRTPQAPPGTSAAELSGAKAAAVDAGSFGAAARQVADAVSGAVSNATAPPQAAAAGLKTDADSPLPPSWDPLGVAPFAWDLPEPSPPPPPPAPRSRYTPAVLAVTLLVTGVGIGASALGIAWFTPLTIASLSLAVLAAGLVLGGLLRQGAGLIVPAILLAAGVAVASAGPFQQIEEGVGSRAYTPSAEAELSERYSLGLGEIELDLRQLTLTADRDVEVSVGTGQITVRVPKGMRIEADCDVATGDTACDVPGNPATGPTLRLHATAGLGEVEVHRD